MESISILEKYCEALYDAYQFILNYLSLGEAVQPRPVSLASLEDKLKKPLFYLDELQVSLKKELKKKLFFFLIQLSTLKVFVPWWMLYYRKKR